MIKRLKMGCACRQAWVDTPTDVSIKNCQLNCQVFFFLLDTSSFTSLQFTPNVFLYFIEVPEVFKKEHLRKYFISQKCGFGEKHVNRN